MGAHPGTGCAGGVSHIHPQSPLFGPYPRYSQGADSRFLQFWPLWPVLAT